MSDRYITLPAKCCGTCQHWSGSRVLDCLNGIREEYDDVFR